MARFAAHRSRSRPVALGGGDGGRAASRSIAVAGVAAGGIGKGAITADEIDGAVDMGGVTAHAGVVGLRSVALAAVGGAGAVTVRTAHDRAAQVHRMRTAGQVGRGGAVTEGTVVAGARGVVPGRR